VGKSQRRADAHTDPNCDAHSDSNCNADSYASTGRRWMLASLDIDAGLHRRQQGKPERYQLHGEFLDAKPKSLHQQWWSGQRPAMDIEWLMRRTQPDADT
jgi:hypothetical protein